MSKAFVIKNKEGKYAFALDSNTFTDEIINALIYNEYEKSLMLEEYSNLNFVEITIAEGDLEQENKQLKERIQNILEGKEIPAIYAKKYEEYEKQLAIREKALKFACNLLKEIDKGTKTIAMDNWKFNQHLDNWDNINFSDYFIEQAKESMK